MVLEMYNHYKSKGDHKPMHLMKKHFDIFQEQNVLELISLFERPSHSKENTIDVLLRNSIL